MSAEFPARFYPQIAGLVGEEIYITLASRPLRKHAYLDNQLQQPGVKPALQALAAALGDLVDENRCTRCVVESSSGILTGCLRDVRAAKEKKALKAEAKGLVKTVKGDAKARWRDDKSSM